MSSVALAIAHETKFRRARFYSVLNHRSCGVLWPIFCPGDLRKPGRHCISRCKRAELGPELPLSRVLLRTDGALDEAQETVKRLQTLTNVVAPSATHWRNAEQRELFLSGLRSAAGEAT